MTAIVARQARALVLCAACAFAVPAAAQCPDGTPPPCGRPAVTSAAGANSVAVMLFTNVTGDSAYAYLSDGLSSEIATSLARVPRLEVQSPGAVRAAQRGTAADPRSVGRRLNVRYVVEGDYQRGGDRIRVAVRLVAVPSGTQRWAESYTRPVADLLEVQEDIARSVATAIAGRLLPQEASRLAARPTRDPVAYDRFLRGNFFLAQRTPSGVARAIEEYGAAVRQDSAFAPAHARIALGHALYLDWGWEFLGVPRDSQLARGSRAADRALALDTLSADGWMARAYLLMFVNTRRFEGVVPAFERATTLDPRNAEAWHQFGSALGFIGRYEASFAASRRALDIEPARAVTWLQLGNLYEVTNQDAAALAAYDNTLAADPGFYAAYAFRTWVKLRAGDVAGAAADAAAALRTSPPREAYYGHAPLAAVAARRGDTAAARRHMNAALALVDTRSPAALVTQMLAFGLAAAGAGEEAMDWLERSEPMGLFVWLNAQYPELDGLRSTERFRRLVAGLRPPGAVER